MKRIVQMLILLGLLSWLPCALGEQAQKPSHEDLIKAGQSYTKVVEVVGKKLLFFAQNSPEWAHLWATDDVRARRTFGDSGCAVAAFANASVNSLPMRRLREISNLARSPIAVDNVSLSRYYGLYKGRFLIENDSDYLRYWPLVLGNLSAQNNTFGVRENRNMKFYDPILKAFGVSYSVTSDPPTALEALGKGALIVTCSTGKGSPYAENGHYFVLAGVDDSHFYILDSFIRDKLPRDTNRRVEILEPGVQRVKIEHFNKVVVGPMYIIWPLEDAEQYTQERLETIVARSNRHE